MATVAVASSSLQSEPGCDVAATVVAPEPPKPVEVPYRLLHRIIDEYSTIRATAQKFLAESKREGISEESRSYRLGRAQKAMQRLRGLSSKLEWYFSSLYRAACMNIENGFAGKVEEHLAVLDQLRECISNLSLRAHGLMSVVLYAYDFFSLEWPSRSSTILAFANESLRLNASDPSHPLLSPKAQYFLHVSIAFELSKAGDESKAALLRSHLVSAFHLGPPDPSRPDDKVYDHCKRVAEQEEALAACLTGLAKGDSGTTSAIGSVVESLLKEGGIAEPEIGSQVEELVEECDLE